MQTEEDRALVANRLVDCHVPTHEDLAVPQSQLAAPEIAALVHRAPTLQRPPLRLSTAVGDLHGLDGYDLLAAPRRLPRCPPGARQPAGLTVILPALPVLEFRPQLLFRDSEKLGELLPVSWIGHPSL